MARIKLGFNKNKKRIFYKSIELDNNRCPAAREAAKELDEILKESRPE